MGDFNVEIHATGGHGCQRGAGHGEVVDGCQQPGCPDCIIRECVDKLKAAGHMVRYAVLRHWPGQLGEVIDNLITKVRHGKF